MTQDKYNRKPRQPESEFHKIPPCAPEIEPAVLGALMIDKNAYPLVYEILSPETFRDPRNQMVYAAIQELRRQSNPCDILSVTEQIAKMGNLEGIGGPCYVTELSSRVASSANIEYHANILAQKKLGRDYIDLADKIQKMAFDETADNDDIAPFIINTIISLNPTKRDGYQQVDPIFRKTIDRLSILSGKDISGVPSGFKEIDELTTGWQGGDLIIGAARPAMGKTSFITSMALNTAVKYKIPVGIASLEMTKEQIAHRLMSNLMEIPGKKFLTGKFELEEWDRIDKYLNLLLGVPLYIDDTPGISVYDFKLKAHQLVKEHGVKLLIVDYLQLMNANGAKFHNRVEEVGIISRELKNTAKELDIPIIALSQLNRSVEKREGLEGKRPQLSDLRESGAIEQDADVVFFIHRPEYYHIYVDDNGRDLKGKAQIIFAKHRKGDCGDVVLNFTPQYTRFSDSFYSTPF